MAMTNVLAGVCCECGRVRSAEGVWVRLPVDGLLQTVTVARRGERIDYAVSHGLCPACEAAHLLEILRARAEREAACGG